MRNAHTIRRTRLSLAYLAIAGCGLLPLHATVTITGNAPESSGTTFTFNVGPTTFYQLGNAMIFGAQTNLPDDQAQWAISFTSVTSAQAFPLAGATTLPVNYAPAPSPIRGKGIMLMTRLGSCPVVVTNDNPNTINVLTTDSTGIKAVFQVPEVTLPPMLGQPAVITSVAALEEVNQNRGEDITELSTGMLLYSTVKPAAGSFGDPGSGLVMSIIAFLEEGKKLIRLANASAEAITTASPFLATGTTPVASITGTQCLATTSRLEQTYVGMTVTAGVGADAGANSVVATSTTLDVSLHSLVAAAVIPPGGNAVIAALGSGVTVTATQLAVMTTSTTLNYLVVCGGVQGIGNPDRQIYALPIMLNSGLLANINAAPTVTFATDGTFVRREFSVAPGAPGDCYAAELVPTSTNAPARVGAGELPQAYAQMIVIGDAVYAAVTADGATQPAGLYHSQVIFAANGTILRWTPWRLMGGSAQPVYSAAVDASQGLIWNITNDALSNPTKVTRTIWSSTNTSLASIASTEVASGASGVQVALDIPRSSTTPAHIGLIAAAGFNSITLFQADELDGSIIRPTTAYASGFTANNGSLAGFAPGVTWIASNGGALNDCGAITSFTCATDGTSGWIVTGGSNGAAALTTASGAGWTSLTEGFTGLTAAYAWYALDLRTPEGAPITIIEKMIQDGTNLYILTRDSLYRLPIAATTFVPGTALTAYRIAQATQNAQQNDTFADCFVRDNVALIAAQSGLLRNGNNTSPATAQTPQDFAVTTVPLPGIGKPITQLWLIGPAVEAGAWYANIYALNGNVSELNSTIYRVTISYTGTMTDSTVMPIQDLFRENVIGAYQSIGDYRNSVATDGARLALGRSRYGDATAFYDLLSFKWSTFHPTYFGQKRIVQRAQRVLNTPDTARTGAPCITSASGAWLVPYGTALMSNA